VSNGQISRWYFEVLVIHTGVVRIVLGRPSLVRRVEVEETIGPNRLKENSESIFEAAPGSD